MSTIATPPYLAYDIVAKTATALDVHMHDMFKDKVKTHRVAQARRYAWYLIRKHTKMSFPEIARMFGRDHSTIVHQAKKVESEKDIYADVYGVLMDVERAMGFENKPVEIEEA